MLTPTSVWKADPGPEQIRAPAPPITRRPCGVIGQAAVGVFALRMLNRRGGGKQLRTNYDLRDIQVCAAAKGNNAMNHGTAQNHKYALHRRRLPPAKLNSISAALGGGACLPCSASRKACQSSVMVKDA